MSKNLDDYMKHIDEYIKDLDKKIQRSESDNLNFKEFNISRGNLKKTIKTNGKNVSVQIRRDINHRPILYGVALACFLIYSVMFISRCSKDEVPKTPPSYEKIIHKDNKKL